MEPEKKQKIIKKKKSKQDPVDQAPDAKNVIYAEIDEEITSIFEKIQKCQSRKLFVVIPKRSILFQSLINVKILKRKVLDAGKEMSFVTTDENGAYFAAEAGIPVYRNLKLEENEPSSGAQPETTIDTVVRFTKEDPQKRDSKKLSIDDLKRDRHRPFFAGILFNLKQLWQNYRTPAYRQADLMRNPHRQALLTLIVSGILLLIFIIYITLPHATLYISPNKEVVEQSVNVTLADKVKNEGLLSKRPRRVLASYPLDPPDFTHTIKYKTSGVVFEGNNARGKITVINEADRAWSFIPRTQFHTPDGLVFRAVDYVNVPAKSAEGPGKAVIDVIADEFDTAGRPVGERGNIGPVRFKIAKLAEESQALIYGESTEAMTGGVTVTKAQVTDADYNNALELAKKQLREEIPKKLNEYLSEQTTLVSSGLKLLDITDAIIVEEPQAFADRSVIGTNIEEFPVTATVKVHGLAFNESEMLVTLKNELLLRETPDKKIEEIDNKGVYYRIFQRNDEAGILELTATIKGVEVYDLDPNKQAGINLIKKIKDNVTGLRNEDAKVYMENLPEIEKVEIKNWPFWAPSLPNLKDNIKIIIDPITSKSVE